MSQSYIYVIGPENGPYKIGFSSNPLGRCRQLQTGHSQPLKIHYTREIDVSKVKGMEKIIHKQIAYMRVRGEWFDVPLDDLKGEIDFAFIRWEGESNLNLKYRMNLL